MAQQYKEYTLTWGVKTLLHFSLSISISFPLKIHDEENSTIIEVKEIT